jgi:NADH-quinone oxidoreductase subunit M
LKDFHGLYEHMPSMAGFFLLTGLASIGFPGTIGFIAIELLVEGAVEVYPLVGCAVVLAAALNGIAILFAYFRIFTGRRSSIPVSLTARLPERLSVLCLTVLIVGGGLFPQQSVASRYHAATELEKHRGVLDGAGKSHEESSHGASRHANTEERDDRTNEEK